MADEPERVIDFRLPSLGSDMDYGTVLAWRVGPGDEVQAGDVLLEIDTEKSDIEVEVWFDGVIAEILVPEGTEVPVGTPLARMRVSSDVEEPGPPPTPPPGESSAPPEAGVVRPPVAAGGSGLDGPFPTPRMVHWPGRPATTAGGEGTRASRRQAAVAAVMARANREIPHFHLSADLDLRRALAWLEAANGGRPPPERIIAAALLLRATAVAVADHPGLNGHWVDGGFVGADHVDLGVAVHIRGGGLMTPVLPEAEAMPLDVLMGELLELVGRARSGRLRPRDTTDASLTVTNVGEGGADAVFGVIRPPQVALVGFGRIRDGIGMVDGEAVGIPTLTVTLSGDHRANNGQTGSAFLATLAAKLDAPEAL